LRSISPVPAVRRRAIFLKKHRFAIDKPPWPGYNHSNQTERRRPHDNSPQHDGYGDVHAHRYVHDLLREKQSTVFFHIHIGCQAESLLTLPPSGSGNGRVSRSFFILL